MLNQIILGDCYELMKGIPDGSIDLVLTDPPYNTTACEWDKQPIDLPDLWKHFKRVLKPKGAVVMTGSQPFTTDLILSNRKWFGYCLVWEKQRPTGFLSAKNKPLKSHEDVIVFYSNKTTYNPQGLRPTFANNGRKNKGGAVFGEGIGKQSIQEIGNYPRSVVSFDVGNDYLHPTQKPVELFEYLIRTYSNPGETILDPFAGSGTAALAAHATGRNFICMERERKYCEIANKRLALAQMQGRFEEMVG
jgi:site-specific DNA-methyltransferase (adenine-specific)